MIIDYVVVRCLKFGNSNREWLVGNISINRVGIPVV